MTQEKNTQKKNTLTKAILGIVFFLLILLIGAFTFLKDDSEKDSVSMVNSSQEESSTTTEVVDNSQIDNSNDSSDSDVVKPIATTPDEPCLDDEKWNKETGECEEKGFGGADETDFTKNLFPYAETDETGGNLERFSTVNGHIQYYNIFSFDEGEKIGLTVGYMEGCPNGCSFNDETSCPEACHIPENWRPLKTFEGTGSTQYTGVFKRDGYEDTTEFYCEIETGPLRLTYCSHVKYFEMGEWIRHRIVLDKDAPAITLP